MTFSLIQHRLQGPSKPFLLGGAAETASTLQLSVDVVVSYPDGSTDSLPARTLALLPDGITTVFDRSIFKWIGYTVKGSGALSVVKETDLSTLDGTVCPLTWIVEDGCHYWQPVKQPLAPLAAPILVSPQLTPDSAYGYYGLTIPTTDTVTYTWLAVTTATSYQIQVSADPTFATTLHDVSGLAGLTYLETTALVDNTEYYWRVRAYRSAFVGPWSYISFFVVLDTYATVSPPNGTSIRASYNSAPIGGGIYTFDFYYTGAAWTMLAGESETGSLLFHEASGSPGIYQGTSSLLTTSTQLVIPGSPAGTYFGPGPPPFTFSESCTLTYTRLFYPTVIPTGAIPATSLPGSIYPPGGYAAPSLSTTNTVYFP